MVEAAHQAWAVGRITISLTSTSGACSLAAAWILASTLIAGAQGDLATPGGIAGLTVAVLRLLARRAGHQ
jgi:hypothetical protein